MYVCARDVLRPPYNHDARARSSLSPDGSRLAVSNLVYGFDIYDTNSAALVTSVAHKFGKEFPVPVAFLHGGRAIMSGSTTGVIRIWYIEGAISRKMQSLSVTGMFWTCAKCALNSSSFSTGPFRREQCSRGRGMLASTSLINCIG